MSARKSRDAAPPAKTEPTTSDPLRNRPFARAIASVLPSPAKTSRDKSLPAIPTVTKPMPAKPMPARPQTAPIATVAPSASDRALFARAMSGVKRLENTRNPKRVGGASNGTSSSSQRRALAEGATGLTVRWHSQDRAEAVRSGRWFALEALQRFAAIENTLDLHGLDRVAAQSRVSEFVRVHHARGRRTLRIIYGVGKHAPDGRSVLCDAVVETLSSAPSCTRIDAFCTDDERPGSIVVALQSDRARR